MIWSISHLICIGIEQFEQFGVKLGWSFIRLHTRGWGLIIVTFSESESDGLLFKSDLSRCWHFEAFELLVGLMSRYLIIHNCVIVNCFIKVGFSFKARINEVLSLCGECNSCIPKLGWNICLFWHNEIWDDFRRLKTSGVKRVAKLLVISNSNSYGGKRHKWHVSQKGRVYPCKQIFPFAWMVWFLGLRILVRIIIISYYFLRFITLLHHDFRHDLFVVDWLNAKLFWSYHGQ